MSRLCVIRKNHITFFKTITYLIDITVKKDYATLDNYVCMLFKTHRVRCFSWYLMINWKIWSKRWILSSYTSININTVIKFLILNSKWSIEVDVTNKELKSSTVATQPVGILTRELIWERGKLRQNKVLLYHNR